MERVEQNLPRDFLSLDLTLEYSTTNLVVCYSAKRGACLVFSSSASFSVFTTCDALISYSSSLALCCVGSHW